MNFFCVNDGAVEPDIHGCCPQCGRAVEVLKPTEELIDGIKRHWLEVNELERLAAK